MSWEQWSEQQQESFRRYRDPAQWWLLYEGIAAGNGGGDAISAERAAHLVAAFSRPYSYGRVHEAGLYDDAGFCQLCGVAYCCQHWRVSRSGYGHCPAGHGKSLDPHWSPELFRSPLPPEFADRRAMAGRLTWEPGRCRAGAREAP